MLELEVLTKEKDETLYSSLDNSTEWPILPLRSGDVVPYFFNISIYDINHHFMNEMDPNDGKIFATLGEVKPGGVGSISGNTFGLITDGAGIFQDDFRVFAPPFSNATILFTVQIYNQRTNVSYNLETSYIITFINCVVGEVYDTQIFTCNKCPEGTFSFIDPFVAKDCIKCDPDKLDCRGGSEVYPKRGFWRISNVSDKAISCPNPYACLGGTNELNETSPTGFCAETYTGNACGNCEEGYAKYGNDNVCVNCNTDVMYYVKLGGFFCLQIISVIVTVYSNYKAGEEENDQEVKQKLY